MWKTAQLETLATFKSVEQGWRRTASRGTSHFAQANQKSIQAILNAVHGKYSISEDPADYIFVVYRAVTQDEPNGNGDAFPRDELLSWNKYEKKPVYQTFEFKPKHVNHQADDPHMARGVVIDAHYNESDPNDCFIEILVAIDTKKDPILAQGILEGALTQVSMGCDALRTECNVCDNVAYSEKDYCPHIKKGNRMKMHKSPSGEMKLAFERCYEVTFQEISNVDDPADKTADQQEMLTVDELPPTAKTAASISVLDLQTRIRHAEESQQAPAFARAASQGRETVNKQAAKKKDAAPEHHVVAACYAKHHELSFGDHNAAMKACAAETGKSEHEIKAAWAKKMAEDTPHPEAAAICASLNAQLLACGDMKKACKRTAEDKDIDSSMVEKCAAHMKECNRMANYEHQAGEETPPTSIVGAGGAPAAPDADKKAKEEKEEADKKAAAEKDEADKKAAEGKAKEEVEKAAKVAARRIATAQKLKIARAAKIAQSDWSESDGIFTKTFGSGEEGAIVEVSPGKFECLMNLGGKDHHIADADSLADAKGVLESRFKELTASKRAQMGAAPSGVAEVAQAADAPNKKTLGDMGVKTGGEGGPPPDIQKKIDEKEKEAKLAKKAQAEKDEADKKAAAEKEDAEKKAQAEKDEADKKAASKTAAQFPFAEFYKDVTALSNKAGDVYVRRAGKVAFVIPAAKKASAPAALQLIASHGIVGAMKKLGGIKKQADAGVGEGAVSDFQGGYAPSAQSSQEGAISDGRQVHKINPPSATAQGATTDGKLKVETKDIGNSNVREQVTTDNKGGREVSPDTTVGLGEHSDGKTQHDTKNVGKDNVLSQRQTDMILKGLDPRTANLIKERLAKVAQEHADEEKAKEAARVAQAEKDEKEKAEKKAQSDKEETEKKAAEEKEVEKKAVVIASARIAKFQRGIRLAARRFALNLEPCDLKWNLGAVLSTRHEASQYGGMDGDLVKDVIERGFNTNAAMERTVDHMIKRASEFTAMPDDSLAAIEADAQNLSPIDPEASAEPVEPEHHESRAALLRRRASMGSMPTLLPGNPPEQDVLPTRHALVREAMSGGGIVGSRYLKR